MKALRFAVSVPQFLTLKALGALFPGLYYRGPLSTVHLDEVPEPTLPSPEWVKIRTLICGFCGSDQSLIFLLDSPTASPFTSFPCVLGHELCGEIVEMGSGVKNFRVGGFTKVFDVVAKAETLRSAMRVMAAGVLSVVGIGNEVKLDLTPLWLKLQTIRGVYSYGYHLIDGERLHAYDLALRLVREEKVRLDEMITHRFRLEEYGKMIEVNRNKAAHRAIKTAVSFM